MAVGMVCFYGVAGDQVGVMLDTRIKQDDMSIIRMGVVRLLNKQALKPWC